MILSLNLNADLSLKDFREAARLAESVGYFRIWIGESISYGHSFSFLAMAAEETRRIQIGAGILSPQLNRCHHIIRAFQTLQEVYGERFAVALAPGDLNEVQSAGANSAKPVETVLQCVKELKKRRDEKKWKLPVYVGASGPRLIAEGSMVADGVLLNYVHPEFVDWAMHQMKRKTFVAAYGPALLLPDPVNEPLLREAATMVIAGANEVFLSEFSLTTQAGRAREVLARKHSKTDLRLSLDRFVLAGNLTEMKAMLEKLFDKGVDEVILATPMCRNLPSVKTLGATLIA